MKVLIFEEHSSVLAHWWREHTHSRTLVYLDAHLDLQQINQKRLNRLEECTCNEQVEALAKPHPLWPDGGVSYSLENFLFPAARLGFIERLIWVAPPHVGTGYSRDNFERLCQMDGVQFDELCQFRKVNEGWIEGRILGLDVTICDYLQLERIPLPPDSLIDIDIDYFVALPGDVAWVNPMAVFRVLDRLPAKPPFITISRSVESGFTPLRYRFIADYLAALWERREHDRDHYDRLFHLDRRLRSGERAAVLAGCEQELENHPECAATWYLRSLAEPDHAQAAGWRSQAAALSSAYRTNPLRAVCEIRGRQLTVSLAEVLALQERSARAALKPEERVLIEVELGLIYCAFGQLERALDCYRRAVPLWGGHPELALEIAKLLVESGQEEPAAAFLRKALEDDKTRTAAHLLLAHLATMRGRLEPARQHLEHARNAAPAWGQLLDMLAFVHLRLGHAEQARELREESERRQRRGEQLARQFID